MRESGYRAVEASWLAEQWDLLLDQVCENKQEERKMAIQKTGKGKANGAERSNCGLLRSGDRAAGQKKKKGI